MTSTARRRPVTRILFALLLFPVLTVAAPVPKAKAPELYFPTTEGTTRVMRTASEDGTSTEATQTVTKVEEKDGVYTVTTTREVGGQRREFRNEVSAKGVFSLPLPGEKGEPRAALKLPAKEGDTWTTEQPAAGGRAGWTTKHTVGKEEEVEVPAGKFKAIVVTTEYEVNGVAYKGTAWYAAGVGVVKSVSVSDRTERVQELKEFTPGKK
jgi:hypothetical protein